MSKAPNLRLFRTAIFYLAAGPIFGAVPLLLLTGPGLLIAAYMIGAIPAALTGFLCAAASRRQINRLDFVLISIVVGVASSVALYLAIGAGLGAILIPLPGGLGGLLCGWAALSIKWLRLPSTQANEATA